MVELTAVEPTRSKNPDASETSISAGILSSAFALSLASIGFMIAGVVRTKAAATWFGVDGLGLFSQATQLQGLLITLCGAGLATAGRVALSRGDLSEKDLRERLAWMLWTPILWSTVLVIVVRFLSVPLASVVFGDAQKSTLLTIAVLGLPAAVAGQVAIGAAQAMGERSHLVLAALASSLSAAVAVIALMSTRNIQIGTWSLVAAPVVQFVVVVAMCPSLRSRVFSRPRLPSHERRMLFVVAGASMALGASSALGENLARASVVLARGIGVIGAYQPATVLSTQLFSIVLSALATTVLVSANKRGWHPRLGADISRTGQDLVLIVTGLALMTSAFRSIAIPILFDSNMLGSGKYVVLSLAAEPMRCASWVAGAVLLPLGLQRAWLFVGLTVVTTQTAIGLGLSHFIGVWALPIGYWASALVSVIFTIIALSKHQVSVGVRLPILATLCSISVLAVGYLDQPPLWNISLPSMLATLPLTIAAVRVALDHNGPLRSLLTHIPGPWRTKWSTCG